MDKRTKRRQTLVTKPFLQQHNELSLIMAPIFQMLAFNPLSVNPTKWSNTLK